MSTSDNEQIYDLFIVGGGINGCGIARDAAGRGLSVALAEMNDLASATSSASTKLFHGGLRYLEYFEFRLVREALIERENLLVAMPHISWPMRFVLPYHQDMRFESNTPTSKLLTTFMPWMKGQRPAWLIRLGLFMYDNLGGREILPGTITLNLQTSPEGKPIKEKFERAYEYSDCWVEDSRLVVLNARDAENRGAKIMTRTKVVDATSKNGVWTIKTEDQLTGKTKVFSAKLLVNAGGPWVEDIIRGIAHIKTNEGIRLVRGSHIVTKKLFDHDKAYFFQGEDGRIIFAIPYEQDFTLIGTTDQDHDDIRTQPECTPEEQEYLCKFASQYFKKPIKRDDIVWTYSGVRPLYDDNASSSTAATREYVLKLNETGQAPALNIFGGKITTYRRLAESAIAKFEHFFPQIGEKWTKRVALPGGDFQHHQIQELADRLQKQIPDLSHKTAQRLIRAYGTDAFTLTKDATNVKDLGKDFGQGIYASELDWVIANEWVRTADDYLWRRTKMGLRVDEAQKRAIEAYIVKTQSA
ncbi:glycerol-3-phosphate dehydrogenase [Maritalea porphyrae]|uniref:Glycerol-3-phosphate dehydrogenase n=1 Tax=Maritalea porphyrae TaxID=880732 RepID=A0ABQ5UN86_9HYPH|nr:glycerol-3-phosphate dehydrogenase [Maritalea porphyrae]GLQ16127.1 glycerol-3-phosphate dehydrogenase [Maritalea porphyrae]